MSRVFWDTNLFVYLLQGEGPLGERTRSLARQMRERGDVLVTSTMTLGEILTKPVRDGDVALARRLEHLVQQHATVVAFDVAAATHYAKVRQDTAIRPPDAIQLACAATAQVDLFVTNDDRLTRRKIAGIHFVVSLHDSPI